MHSMKYVCIGGKYGSQPACNGTRALPFLPNMSALEFTVANSVDKNKSSCNGRRGELSMAHTTRPASCSLLNYVLLIGTGAEVINDCDNTDSVPTRDRKRMTEDLLAAVSRILDELIIAPCIPPCFPIFQLKQLFLISFY
ncbi:uncharacterized protein LOC111321821 isoform X2 [Stylophora pistillata]|uniref:uncharacterized protein LOC111321821 isoform X2 n=1 Tax=Stylophora pistillata TaxID=50429 RepID=UPI000C051034|nr:uncharacterized protein LOC111321821 isoform X2 [Stylophora pistillata]